MVNTVSDFLGRHRRGGRRGGRAGVQGQRPAHRLHRRRGGLGRLRRRPALRPGPALHEGPPSRWRSSGRARRSAWTSAATPAGSSPSATTRSTRDDDLPRFPGVEGSAYFIGGLGVNYQRADDITLAPIRAGVGFRLGANIGYLAYTREAQHHPVLGVERLPPPCAAPPSASRPRPGTWLISRRMPSGSSNRIE